MAPISLFSAAAIIALSTSITAHPTGDHFQRNGPDTDIDKGGSRVAFLHLGVAHAASGTAYVRTYLDTAAFLRPIDKICESVDRVNSAFFSRDMRHPGYESYKLAHERSHVPAIDCRAAEARLTSILDLARREPEVQAAIDIEVAAKIKGLTRSHNPEMVSLAHHLEKRDFGISLAIAGISALVGALIGAGGVYGLVSLNSGT